MILITGTKTDIIRFGAAQENARAQQQRHEEEEAEHQQQCERRESCIQSGKHGIFNEIMVRYV